MDVSFQHKVAKWRTTILKPVLDYYSVYYIKDSFQFPSRISW